VRARRHVEVRAGAREGPLQFVTLADGVGGLGQPRERLSVRPVVNQITKPKRVTIAAATPPAVMASWRKDWKNSSCFTPTYSTPVVRPSESRMGS